MSQILVTKKELVQQLKDNTTKNSEKEKEELKQLKSSIEALEASIDAKNEVLKGLVPPHDASAYRDWETDRKSTRLNSSHEFVSRMPSSA